MNEKKGKDSGPESFLENWMHSATAFWSSMAEIWPGPSLFTGMQETTKEGTQGRTSESIESTLKLWNMLSSAMSDPNMKDSLFQGIGVVPEILMKAVQSGWQRYFELQQQWMERAGHIGKKTEAYKFEEIDQDTFKSWMEIYEEEFRKFLNIPQLGLTRFYQERMGRLFDKCNLLQGAMAEFMYLLYLPMEKTSKVMQEELEERAREGEVPESSQEYYRIWLKILEGHYMTLFKSTEYIQMQSRTLGIVEEFIVARQEFFQDILQILPVPTNKDMDDLYKDLYELKKKVKKLEKKQLNN